MTHSMTAYARKTAEVSSGYLSCEIRSVNHRYLELAVRLPEALASLEMPLREQIRKQLGRGKVECTFRLHSEEGETSALQLNMPLVRALVAAAQSVESVLSAGAPLNPLDILRWPNVVKVPEQQNEDSISAQVIVLLDETLADFCATRKREGEALSKTLFERLQAMETALTALSSRLPDLLVQQRARLKARLEEVSSMLDAERLEQEMVIYAQRSDVSEEMDRLRAHIAEVRRVLTNEQVAGRRLDFLMQEMNREANTLGSKSTDIESTRLAVDLKVLIEQMREQVQNIE